MTESSATTHLRSLLDDISPPESYFAGLSQVAVNIPRNLLAFRRTELPGGQHSFHHRYVLIYNLETAGHVYVDGIRLKFSPGDALLIFPHQFHHYGELEADRIGWLFVTFELWEPRGLEPCKYRVLAQTTESRRLLEQLMLLYPSIQGTADSDRALLAVAGLLLELQRAAGSEQGWRIPVSNVSIGETIERVGAFVHENLHRPFTIADVAAAVSCSESHLRAVFRQSIGTSFGRYLRRARLYRSEGMLLTSDMSISAIAERCGYESVYAFSRAFKRFNGISPSRWRNRHRRDSPARG